MSDTGPLDNASAVPLEAAHVPTHTTAAQPSLTEAERTAQLATAREQIYASLKDRHTIKPPLSYALLGGGLSLMLAIGVVLSLIVFFITAFMFNGSPLSFHGWLLLYVLAMIPLVFWIDRRARQGFFSFNGDVDLTRDNDADTTAEALLRRGAGGAQTLLNALLWPPRAFVAGLHAMLGVPQRGLDLVLPEAADTLTLMLTLDGAVKLVELAPPDADPMQLMPVLKWLDANDYIGIGTRGDRVWVSSPAKKRFVEQGIRVPMPATT